MRIDTSGNLGIGTSSPVTKLDVNGGAQITGSVSGYGGGEVRLGPTTANTQNGISTQATGSPQLLFDHRGTSNTGSFVWRNGTGGASTLMTLDGSGNLLVGTTSAGMTAGGVRLKNAGGNLGEIALSNNSGSADYVARFLWGSSATLVGNITVSSVATVYNTTSDYRLKTVTGAVTGQGARIDALKPIDYLWTEGGQQARGFLAHEFQAVYSNSVTGDKDAVDADGNPKYQSMQAATSEVIADLVAEIQSLRKRLADAGI
jgi:hypothetical protein